MRHEYWHKAFTISRSVDTNLFEAGAFYKAVCACASWSDGGVILHRNQLNIANGDANRLGPIERGITALFCPLSPLLEVGEAKAGREPHWQAAFALFQFSGKVGGFTFVS